MSAVGSIPSPGTAATVQPNAVSMPISATDSFDPGFTVKPLSTMRRRIGQRLHESKSTAPHFYLSSEIVIDKVLATRKHLKDVTPEAAPTVNDFIIKATALALIQTPELNAALDGQSLRQFSRADIAFAVALPSGLVAPVIRAADVKPLAAIAHEARTIVERARTNKLSPDDYRGGTFTISNLGGFRVKEFVAIINPPQAGILSIGQASPRVALHDGSVTIETVLVATLSADHRIIDGVTGARFLEAVQDLLAAPERLLT